MLNTFWSKEWSWPYGFYRTHKQRASNCSKGFSLQWPSLLYITNLNYHPCIHPSIHLSTHPPIYASIHPSILLFSSCRSLKGGLAFFSTCWPLNHFFSWVYYIITCSVSLSLLPSSPLVYARSSLWTLLLLYTFSHSVIPPWHKPLCEVSCMGWELTLVIRLKNLWLLTASSLGNKNSYIITAKEIERNYESILI